jgi:hypothetical protein
MLAAHFAANDSSLEIQRPIFQSPARHFCPAVALKGFLMNRQQLARAAFIALGVLILCL